MIVMKFEKGVPGDTTIAGYEDWLGVDSLSWGVNRNVTMSSAKGAERRPGNPSFSDVQVMRTCDKASPGLWDQATHGLSLGTAEVHFLQTGTGADQGPVALLVIKLHEAIISSYQMSGGGDSDPTESFTVNFTKVEYQYDPHSGTEAKSGDKKTWNLVTGKTAI